MDPMCKHCLESKCICDPPGIYCDICCDLAVHCIGHSIRKQPAYNNEEEQIESIVRILLSNEKILDKVLERLEHVRKRSNK